MRSSLRHSGVVSSVKSIFSRERSTRGASIIIAFVFMLICVCICAIVLGHASMGSVAAMQKKENDTNYYALSSALEQAGRIFEDDSPLADMYMTEKVDTSTGATSRVAFPVPTTPSDMPKAVYDWLSDAVGKDALDTSKTLDVDVTVSYANADEWPDVKLTYSINSDYTIIITAKLKNADPDNDQMLQVEIPRRAIGTSGVLETTYTWNADRGAS